jgi:hypothetical protein
MPVDTDALRGRDATDFMPCSGGLWEPVGLRKSYSHQASKAPVEWPLSSKNGTSKNFDRIHEQI